MGLKVEHWILVELILISRINVPNTNSLVVRSTEQESLLHWVPSQAITFLSVPCQTEIWFYLIVNWCLWMFVIIKNINFTINSFSGYYLLILWHISSSVNFSLMIYLHINRYSCLLLVSNSAAANSIDSFSIQDIFSVISGVFT
jgi:hypothetical protein